MTIPEIEKDIENKIAEGLNRFASEGTAIIDASYGQFYGGGAPSEYIRTGGLYSATMPPIVSVGGMSGSATVGYEPSSAGGHSSFVQGQSGRWHHASHPSGYEGFINSAEGGNGGMRPPAGNSSFDDVALAQVRALAESIMSSLF